MNNKFLKAAFGAAICLSATQSVQAQTLKATLSDMKGDSVFVYLKDTNAKTRGFNDTISLKNGAFEYTLKGQQPTNAGFYVKEKRPDGRTSYNTFDFILMPGEKAVVSGTSDNFTVSGTPFYTEYAKAMAPVWELARQRKALIEKYRPIMTDENASKEAQDKAQAEYMKESSAIVSARKDTMLSYIKANPNSEVAAAVVSEMGLMTIEEGYAQLSDNMKNGRMAVLFKGALETIQKEKEREAKMMALNGKPAPAFTLNDINGKPLSLESLKGKYLVLDFWGSWCGWCIKGIPDMKKAYAKHKDKLEILGIDCRDTDAKWKAAVKKHEIPWLHVYNPKDSDLTERYAIQGYPTKVIIDPQGNVVKTVVGEDPEFYTFLDELLK